MSKKYPNCLVPSEDGLLLCKLSNGHKGPCDLLDITLSTLIVQKPKTSTIDKMGKKDLELVNRMVSLSATLYDRAANAPKLGPHTNPAEMDSLKSQVILIAMKVGERVWYPRGNPGRTDSLHTPKDKKRKRAH